jgi:predicted enzyme related to lactoylglutathione lyase
MAKSNPVVWFEIYVQDLARARKFYETVLGVKLEPLPSPNPNDGFEMLMFPADMHAPGSGGALAKMEGFAPGGNSILVYFACTDCAIEGGRIEAAGGRVHRPKMSIGEYGHIVLAIDTEGNMFGLHSME